MWRHINVSAKSRNSLRQRVEMLIEEEAEAFIVVAATASRNVNGKSLINQKVNDAVTQK